MPAQRQTANDPTRPTDPSGQVTGDTPIAGRSEAPAHARGRHLIVVAPIIVVLVIILFGGYAEHWKWTGYLNEDDHRPLTLWDWLSVSLLPLTLALTPVWLRSRRRHPGLWRGAVLALSGVFLVLLVGGYRQRWQWTGFTGNTLWAWVSLFIVPFLLPFAFGILTAEERRRPSTPGTTADEDPTPSGSTSERIAPRVGAAVLTLAVLTAGVLAFVPAPAERPTSASVRVKGTNGRWTATPVALTRGERVDVSAFGLLLPSPRHGYVYVNPDGQQFHHPGQQSISKRIPHAALIATVSPGAPTPLGGIRPKSVIAVGTHQVITAHTAGRLYLGVNDRGTRNNSGSYEVTVKVLP